MLRSHQHDGPKRFLKSAGTNYRCISPRLLRDAWLIQKLRGRRRPEVFQSAKSRDLLVGRDLDALNEARLVLALCAAGLN